MISSFQSLNPAFLPPPLPLLHPIFSTPQFDTYALRHLVQCHPAATTHLSSLAVTPHRVLRRYAVQAVTGERCVMTLTFEHPVSSSGDSGGSGGVHGAGSSIPNQVLDNIPQHYQPQQTYQQPHQQQQAQHHIVGGVSMAAATTNKSSSSSSRWMLAGASGEPRHPDLPLSPSPEHPPETVVQAQLSALRDLDAFTAWRFIAPRVRAKYGGSAERFAVALEAPALSPLLMHGGAASVLQRQRGAGHYHEVVQVESISGGELGGEWVWRACRGGVCGAQYHTRGGQGPESLWLPHPSLLHSITHSLQTRVVPVLLELGPPNQRPLCGLLDDRVHHPCWRRGRRRGGWQLRGRARVWRGRGVRCVNRRPGGVLIP